MPKWTVLVTVSVDEDAYEAFGSPDEPAQLIAYLKDEIPNASGYTVEEIVEVKPLEQDNG